MAQDLQHRLDLGEDIDLVTRVEEHLEAFVGQLPGFVLAVTDVLEGAEQHLAAQGADAVLEPGLSLHQALTDGVQVLHGYGAKVRRIGGQPVAQDGFGANDHGGGVPQGVVEVKGDQLDAHESLPLLRLARGWALS
ncbi:hypothetical protein D9M71_668790 [compost metagenome]